MNEGETEILLVEDDIVTSQLLEFTLQELGYRTIVRANGREGWKAWNKRRSPIVVSDWEMPEMTGIDLVKKIRRQPGQLYTYFICLTARNSPDDYTEAMEAGVDDFLTKPLKKAQLVTRLRVAERILNFQREISDLKNVLPICSYCKKVRNDEESWQKLEVYVERNFNTDISHSICPTCYEDLVEPQFEAIEKRRAAQPAYTSRSGRIGASGQFEVFGSHRYNHGFEVTLPPDEQDRLQEALQAGLIVLRTEKEPSPVAVFGGVFGGRVVSKTQASIRIGGADHTYNRFWADRPQLSNLRGKARDGVIEFAGGLEMEVYESAP